MLTLAELPAQLGLLNHLVEFYASFNKIKKLPADVGRCESLQLIKVSRRPSATALSVMQLSNNMVRDLPPELGNCKSLRSIDLASCKVRVLHYEAFKPEGLEKVSTPHRR